MLGHAEEKETRLGRSFEAVDGGKTSCIWTTHHFYPIHFFHPGSHQAAFQHQKAVSRTRSLVERALTTAAGNDGKFKVGIVGSGPAAFYTAKYLLKDLEGRVNIDMIEKLPTPYGLVRSGVAPDHQDVKSVTNDFASVAADPAVRFFGNVTVGEHVSISQLLDCYHAVVLAYGAEGERRLGIPGEDLQGVDSARDFVLWYNGHPCFQTSSFNLAADTCIIIGQGNVAVDCARLLTEPLDQLSGTDITQRALQALATSSVKSVAMVGRRGPVQAAFTIKELRELTKLPGVRTQIWAREWELLSDRCKQAAEKRELARKFKLLHTLVTDELRAPLAGEKNIHLRFFLAPKEFLEDPGRPGHLGAVRFERTRLEGDLNKSVRAVGTGESLTLPARWALKSVGFKSLCMPGVPFDSSRAVIPTDKGRVLTHVPDASKAQPAKPVPGLYASGWVKRGPTGIIGSNIGDAKETAAAIVQDRPAILQTHKQELEMLLAEARVRVVREEGWAKIDAEEQARGKALNKCREKLTTLDELLKAAHNRPEFLNRLDDIVVFKPLVSGELQKIVLLQLNEVASRLHEVDVSLRLHSSAASLILKESYDPHYGTRPPKRYLERHIVTQLSRMLIDGSLGKHSEVNIAAKGKQLVFSTSRTANKSPRNKWETPMEVDSDNAQPAKKRQRVTLVQD
eukprot:g60555.t1